MNDLILKVLLNIEVDYHLCAMDPILGGRMYVTKEKSSLLHLDLIQSVEPERMKNHVKQIILFWFVMP